MNNQMLIAIALPVFAVLMLLMAWHHARGMRIRLSTLAAEQQRQLVALKTDLLAGLNGHRSDTATTQSQFRTEILSAFSRSTDSLDAGANRLRAELHQKLDAMRTETVESAAAGRRESADALGQFRTTLLDSMQTANGHQQAKVLEIATAVERLAAANETRLDNLRLTVEQKLETIRADNGKQLEAMRTTVDEKLQATLETRLTQNFKAVVEQLDRVHKGLGEMQTLATGVGDLKRVLTNVKVRGNWGEVQLGALLDQVLTTEQYGTNVAVRPDHGDRVEFAIKLPGRGDDSTPVWLPIDAKFPQEDYLRLVSAHDAADPVGFEAASKALEKSIRKCAADIREHYIHPPFTTEFAVMFLPTEGLYAEVARRPALMEELQREMRVMIAGPSTLGAMLNSLQMGFRTLAIQKHTGEVLHILSDVKTHFGKFDTVLKKVHKKLQEASNTVDRAQVVSRAMTRKLRSVELVGGGQPDTALLNAPIDDVEIADAGDAADLTWDYNMEEQLV